MWCHNEENLQNNNIVQNIVIEASQQNLVK